MFKLTFNRPAVRQFIEGGESQGLKIRIQDGRVQFMPSLTSEDDTASLAPRTRGGYESIVEGTGENEILDALKNPNGPFFVLKRVDKDWVQAEPYRGKDAPPKFEPHVRVWHASQPKTGKQVSAKRVRSPKVSEPTTPVDIAERVRWAYGILGEERRPGRPSREFMEARETKRSFEAAALEFMSDLNNRQGIDVKAIVGAYHQIGEFLRTAAPEALNPSAPKVRKTRTLVPSDEETAMVDDAAHKLGFDAIPKPPMARKIRGKVDTRAFAGEAALA